MIELFETDRHENDRHSSKGNQLKWSKNGIWYKADNLGYEGMSETVVSKLLIKSDLKKDAYVSYEPEQIRYKNKVYNGARSRDFINGSGELITLEKLFKLRYGRSLYESVFKIPDVKDRLEFVTEFAIGMTGLKDFGVYIGRLLTIDALFLNDDRHMHNIAVLKRNEGIFDYCPVFDNGAALLSDTSMDYPIDGDVYTLISEARSKTVSHDFDEQLDAAEELYGCNIKFCFDERDITDAVRDTLYYPEDVCDRVTQVLREQRRKYSYLFR